MPMTDELEDLARTLLRRHAPAVPVDIRWDAGGCRVRPARTGAVLLLDRDQLSRAPEMSRFLVAHEVGHIALGHARRRTWVALLALVLGLPLLAAGTAIALSGLSADVAPFVGAWVAMVCMAALAPVAFRLLARPGERAADAFAVDAGYRLDADALRAYCAESAGAAWNDAARRLLGTHPSWEERLRAQEAGGREAEGLG